MRSTRGEPSGLRRGAVVALLLALLPAGLSALPADQQGPMVQMRPAGQGVEWVTRIEKYDRLVLTVSGNGRVVERVFERGTRPVFELVDARGAKLTDGSYTWELRVVPHVDDKVRRRLAAAREAGDERMADELRRKGYLPETAVVASGYFTVRDGELMAPAEPEPEPRPRGRAAYEAQGDLRVAGDLTVEGTKSFVMADPDDAGRAIYFAALEGPEAGTYYRGSAATADGRAVIELPDYFTRVTEPGGLTVQLTPVGDWARLYVAEKSPARLVVRQVEGAQPVEFDFFVQGVRRGYAAFQVVRPSHSSGRPVKGGQR